MQEIVYKKLSKKIEETVEFVDKKDKSIKKLKSFENDDIGIRLLRDTEPITKIGADFIYEEVPQVVKKPKPTIKRRIIEPDTQSEQEKLKLATIEGETVLQQKETRFWKLKKFRPNKLFEYREKKSVLYLVEPKNEFSELRKINNWSESKIATFCRKK